MERWIDRQIERRTDRWIEQVGRQIDRQNLRQIEAERQKDRQRTKSISFVPGEGCQGCGRGCLLFCLCGAATLESHPACRLGVAYPAFNAHSFPQTLQQSLLQAESCSSNSEPVKVAQECQRSRYKQYQQSMDQTQAFSKGICSSKGTK